MNSASVPFCRWQKQALGTVCLRCGSWSREGNPSCIPYVTRTEPDNARLPHIETAAQNQAAYDDYFGHQVHLLERRKNGN